jgi:hypothetical protein
LKYLTYSGVCSGKSVALPPHKIKTSILSFQSIMLSIEITGTFCEAIFKESGDVQYSIKALNAISGKKIGVPGHNFILKPRYTENDMVKVINECLKPIVLTHEDHRVEAKEAKNSSKKEDIKQTEEGNGTSPELKPTVNLSPEVIRKAKNGLKTMGRDTIEALSRQYPEFESMVNKIRNEG